MDIKIPIDFAKWMVQKFRTVTLQKTFPGVLWFSPIAHLNEIVVRYCGGAVVDQGVPHLSPKVILRVIFLFFFGTVGQG